MCSASSAGITAPICKNIPTMVAKGSECIRELRMRHKAEYADQKDGEILANVVKNEDKIALAEMVSFYPMPISIDFESEAILEEAIGIVPIPSKVIEFSGADDNYSQVLLMRNRSTGEKRYLDASNPEVMTLLCKLLAIKGAIPSEALPYINERINSLVINHPKGQRLQIYCSLGFS